MTGRKDDRHGAARRRASAETDPAAVLARALGEAAPAPMARARGIAAAMDAFEAETAGQESGRKSAEPGQGSAAQTRPTEQAAPQSGAPIAPAARAPLWRSVMNRRPLKRRTAYWGGGVAAAAIGAVVLLSPLAEPPELTSSLQSVKSGDEGEAAVAMADAPEPAAAAPRPSVQASSVPASSARTSSALASSGSASSAPPAPERAQPQPAKRALEHLSDELAVRRDRERAEGGLRLDSFVAGRVAPSTMEAASAAEPVLMPAPADLGVGLAPSEGRDRFAPFEPAPLQRTEDAPVSTFSIDVDTAAYAFLRRALNQGALPPAEAIRIEELINYFPYDYAPPDDAGTPFRAYVSVSPSPWTDGGQLLGIGVKGYEPPVAERPRANVVLLADTSGSMNQPDKLPLLINAFRLLLGALEPDDQVAVVAYAGAAGLVLEPTPVSERAKIEAALTGLSAGGSTAGAAGLRLAYDQARAMRAESAADGAASVTRVLLATDGDFNVGFSEPGEMERFVERERESGVLLSVLGFGRGNYNDALMQSLAQNGNGAAAYIDTLSEARKVLADEIGSALVPIAQDVKIQVEFNPARISEYRLMGYETRALRREDFNDDTVDAGDIGSGHTVTAIYEITPAGSEAERIDPLRYGAESAPAAPDALVSDMGASEELAFVKIRYKGPEGGASRLITRPVTDADAAPSLAAADPEMRFAAAVAAFGRLAQGDARLEAFGYDGVLALAGGALGADPFGYRAEFLSLVRLAAAIDRP